MKQKTIKNFPRKNKSGSTTDVLRISIKKDDGLKEGDVWILDEEEIKEYKILKEQGFSITKYESSLEELEKQVQEKDERIEELEHQVEELQKPSNEDWEKKFENLEKKFERISELEKQVHELELKETKIESTIRGEYKQFISDLFFLVGEIFQDVKKAPFYKRKKVLIDGEDKFITFKQDNSRMLIDTTIKKEDES